MLILLCINIGGLVMKKCNHCNREVMDDAKFCQYCGADIPEDMVEPSLENDNIVAEDQEIEAPPLPEVKSTATYDSGTSTYNEGASKAQHANKGLVWLILSSIITLLGCCCMPFGFLQIATIITSAIAVNNYSKGDYEGSDRMARVSMIVFFSILALSVILFVVLLATGTLANIMDSYDFINEFNDFY
jgi:predicted nucleic acid-binding Zn ribbon protein